MEDIVSALCKEGGSTKTWAEGVMRDLQRCSPTSLKITHRHVRAARVLDLRATLQQDFRLACRCMLAHDFYEGVRASLIDRDQAPRWQPDRLAEVSDATVDGYFESLGPDDLYLASRTEMQAVRS